MTPEHLTVLRALLDDKTPAPLTYNEAVLVEYIRLLRDKMNDYFNCGDDVEKFQEMLDAWEIAK